MFALSQSKVEMALTSNISWYRMLVLIHNILFLLGREQDGIRSVKKKKRKKKNEWFHCGP